MSPRRPEQFEEIREEKKKQILNVALRLFANNGYHSTSISKIAQEARISKGLIYNYFESKEALIGEIFQDIVDRTMNMLDPNHDDKISDQEAEDFFDKFFETIIANPEEWKLFYQLSIQQDVMDLLMRDSHSQKIQNSQKVIFDYFMTRDFQDPEIAILLFSSIFKGFALQYAFAPEMFTREMLERFKNKLKELFLKKRVEGKNNDREMDECIGYFLL